MRKQHLIWKSDSLILIKANNNEILTKQKYMALIEDAKQAKAKEKKKKVLTIVVSEIMMFLKLALKKDLLCQ